MKNYSPRLLRLVLLAGLLFGGAARSVLAQGNDNPTGTAGVFNGNSTTGCSYDPYTSNATRTIPDITVAGAVGGYPLQWSRTMNSRAYGNTFGLGAAWRHSYQWIMADSETFNTFEPGAPSSYGVAFPDGRFESFSYNSTTNTCAPFFPGIADRFTPLNLTTLLAYLVLPDGGMVEFKATKWKYHSPDPPYEDTSGYTYKAQRIIDPNGLSTWFTYDTSGKLTQVTEPAGRWLKIYYRTDVGYVGFVNHVDAGYGTGTYTQIVTYVYGTFTYGTSSYKVLTGANYSDGTAATYSYQHSNVSPYTGTPLILNCYDVRYPGPMKNIAYEFVQNGFYGQLSREKHTSGAIVVTLTGGSSGITRTETRGDGAVRTFTYGANAGTSYKGYLLLKQSDFLAQTTNYTYDASGYLSSIKDANLNTTSFTRLAATGAITKITHPGDASHIDYTYEDPTTGYHLKTVTDELFHTTTYLHSNTTTMTTSSVNYPDGGVELFSYNGFNQVTSHTMVSNASGSTGGIETYTYDTGGRGLLKTYTPPTATDGATNYTYDVNDRLSTIKDGRGNTTTLYHDQVGRLTIIQHPDTDQSLVGYAYNPDGTLQSMSVDYSATAAAATSYTYDDYKRLLSVTTPDRFSGDTLNHTTYFWYDKAGNGALEYTHADSNVTRTVLPSGKIMKNVYDADFRKTSSIAGYGSADAATTSFTYDNIGNLWTLKDPNGQSTGKSWSYTYDPRDRLITVDDATINDAAPDKNSLGHTVNFVYDAASNKKSERRANDQVITYDFYDAMNRLLQMTVPQVPTAAAVSHYTWTKAGKLDTFTDPNGKIYNYDYDILNRLSTTTYPTGGGTETRTYDLAGNLATFKNRAGNIQTFTYDARNRETFYSWNSGAVPRWLYYDDASNITACNDGNANITRVYYNDFLLKSETETINNYSDGIARTVTYTYDADGRRASLKYPSGKLFTYDYTGRGQLSHLYDPAITGIPFQAKYGHDASGNRTARNINGKTTFDDANFSSSYYDAVNRITSTQHYWATANPTWSRAFRYGYDAMGNRQYESRDWQGKGDGFQYDQNNQINAYQREGTVDTTSGTVSGALNNDTLNFDANGNRTSVVDNGTTTYYGAANNLNQYPVVNSLWATYDGNGNLKTWNSWTYTYDAMNRLTSALQGTTAAYFWYDGFNRICTWQINDGTGVRFNVWDGWDLAEEYNYSTDTLNTTYLHGESVDEMVSLTRGGVRSYLYQDGRGNTSQVADASGIVKETYRYDLNGKPTVYDANDNVIAGTTVGNRFMFGGREWYQTLGLYNFRNRFYLPEWGRFLQPDPIGFAGDPANMYRYCANNPVNWIDPFGFDPERITVTASGVPPVLQQKLDHPSGGYVGSGGSPLEQLGRISNFDHGSGEPKNDPDVIEIDRIFVDTTELPPVPAQPPQPARTPVLLGDIFDYARTQREFNRYYNAHETDIKSEIRFIETVNNVAGAYAVVGVGGIAAGEALAGTQIALGPPDIRGGLRIADLILRLILGRAGPPPIRPVPPLPGPVAEGPVVPGG